jgi:hypothetical protein
MSYSSRTNRGTRDRVPVHPDRLPDAEAAPRLHSGPDTRPSGRHHLNVRRLNALSKIFLLVLPCCSFA